MQSLKFYGNSKYCLIQTHQFARPCFGLACLAKVTLFWAGSFPSTRGMTDPAFPYRPIRGKRKAKVGPELCITHNDVVHTGPNCPFTQAASVSQSAENIPALPWQPPFTIINNHQHKTLWARQVYASHLGVANINPIFGLIVREREKIKVHFCTVSTHTGCMHHSP